MHQLHWHLHITLSNARSVVPTRYMFVTGTGLLSHYRNLEERNAWRLVLPRKRLGTLFAVGQEWIKQGCRAQSAEVHVQVLGRSVHCCSQLGR